MRTATRIAAYLWVLNFSIYVAAAIALGGDAINGHATGGHYYLAMHGRSTEVSRAIFEYSRWHTYVLWTHFALVAVLTLIARARKDVTDGRDPPRRPASDGAKRS